MGNEENVICPQLDKMLQECIDSIVKKEKFIKYTANKKPLLLLAAGYLSVPHTVDIKGETNEGTKEINLFIKTIVPNVHSTGDFLSLNDVFATERFVYVELSKVFNELQDEANVPNEDRLKMLKGYEESNAQSIILENALVKGYKTRGRFEVHTQDFAEMSVEQLARLHGLGFVLQKIRPEYFNEKIGPLRCATLDNEHFRHFVKNMVKITINNLESNSLKKKVEDFKPTMLDNYIKSINDMGSVYTICHADFRTNNILVKESEGKTTDVILIDYQLIFCGSPVNDLLYFLYLNTDRAFRKKNMNKIIELYYETLSTFLKYFDIDVEDIFPKKELNMTFEKKKDLGLMFSMFFYPLFFVPDAHVRTIDDDMASNDFEFDEDIKQRLNEIIEDFVEMGVL